MDVAQHLRRRGSIVMRQVRRSQLSDDERAVMTHVRRGAEYVVEGMTR